MEDGFPDPAPFPVGSISDLFPDGSYDVSSVSNFLGNLPGFFSDADDDQELLVSLQQSVTESLGRYDDCFRSLRLAITELEELKGENRTLREQFVNLSLGDVEERELDPGGTGRGSSGSRRGGGNGGRGRRHTPKCISIRSPAFLAVKNKGGGSGAPDSRGGSQGSAGGESKLPHRIFLPVLAQGNAEKSSGTLTLDEAPSVQVDVYTQGMVKTELCNKWEDLGWCPYGEQCQFAHGMEELRPVIRHPRYKTQLCRMLTWPGGCPYGHRCHFLHAKTPSP